MIELKVGYFDSRVHAADTNLADYDEIFTLGFYKKNDGGGGHYKKYDPLDAVLPLGFPSSVGTLTHWGLVPDGNVVNPLQAGAIGDGQANDQPALAGCIAFVKWWRETDHEVISHPAADHANPPVNTFTERTAARRRSSW